MKTMKKYWIAFAILTLLSIVGIYFFYFRKKNKTVATNTGKGAGSSDNLGIANDGIEIEQIVPEGKVGAGKFNYGGNSRSFSITDNINLNNIALQHGYSYTIKQDHTIGAESTEIQLFLNGQLLDWVSIDWVIGASAHIPVDTYTGSGGGGHKDDQEQVGTGKGFA